jgi:hypothetical protein
LVLDEARLEPWIEPDTLPMDADEVLEADIEVKLSAHTGVAAAVQHSQARQMRRWRAGVMGRLREEK